jgi:hypothetical protein
MTTDHNATVTYMMWREEHPSNVSILQRVHILQSCLTSLTLIIPDNAWKAIGEKAKHMLSYDLIYMLIFTYLYTY